MQDIYKDGTYYKTNPNWHQEESPWKSKQVIEVIESSYIAKRIDLCMGGKKASLLKVTRKLLFSINNDLASKVFGGWSLSVLAE